LSSGGTEHDGATVGVVVTVGTVVVVSGATVVVDGVPAIVVAVVSLGGQSSIDCVDGALNDNTLMIGKPTAIKRPDLCREARIATMPSPSNNAVM
jgi:hypothetical protein